MPQSTYRPCAVIAANYPAKIRPIKMTMAKNAEPFDLPGKAIIEIRV